MLVTWSILDLKSHNQAPAARNTTRSRDIERLSHPLSATQTHLSNSWYTIITLQGLGIIRQIFFKVTLYTRGSAGKVFFSVAFGRHCFLNQNVLTFFSLVCASTRRKIFPTRLGRLAQPFSPQITLRSRQGTLGPEWMPRVASGTIGKWHAICAVQSRSVADLCALQQLVSATLVTRSQGRNCACYAWLVPWIRNIILRAS